MILKTCASVTRKASKDGMQGNKQPVADFAVRASQKARNNLPELPNTTFMVVICWVSNGKDVVLASNQLHALYTDVRHWEELVDFMDKNGDPKSHTF